MCEQAIPLSLFESTLRTVLAEHRREIHQLLQSAGLTPEDEWLTREQAAKRVGRSLFTIKKWLKDGLRFAQERKGADNCVPPQGHGEVNVQVYLRVRRVDPETG